MSKALTLAAMVCASMGMATNAVAATSIDQANNQLRLGYVTQTDFVATKLYEDGLHPKAEGGSQGGVALGLSRQGRFLGVQKVYLSADVRYLSGTNDYNGFDEGTLEPLQVARADDYQSLDLSAKLGKGFELGAHAQLTPYVTAGYSFWRRDGERSGQYLDEMSNGFYGLGARLQYAATSNLVLTIDGSYARNVNSQTNWVRDGVRFKHDNQTTTQWGVGMNYRLNPQLSVFANWQHTQRKLGISNNYVHGWHERASVIKQQQVQVGVAQNF